MNGQLKLFFGLVFCVLVADFYVLEESFIFDLFLLLSFLIFFVKMGRKSFDLVGFNSKFFLVSFSLFLLLQVVSYFRANLDNVSVVYGVSKSLILVGAVVFFYSFIDRFSEFILGKSLLVRRYGLFWVLVFVPFIYLFLNVLMKALSLDPFEFAASYPDIGYSRSLNYLFGVDILRTPFPLSNGVNTFGTYIGHICVMSLSLFFIARKSVRIYSLAVLLISFTALFLLDTRGVMIGLFLVMILNLSFDIKRQMQIVQWSIVVIGILPLFVVLANLITGNLEFLSFLARDSEELSSGNNRDLIWTSCLLEISNFQWEHLIGFGQYGQVGSGVSSEYADFFKIFNNSGLTNTHNNLLQIFLDTGYLGVLVFYSMLLSASNYFKKYYERHNDKMVLLFQNFIFYLSFIGGTEAVFVHRATFFLTMLLFVFVLIIQRREGRISV
jgi:hypothetical protein